MTSTTTTRLPLKQTLLLGSLMFGLFFGAGNLIFPITLGLQSGTAVWVATIGFLVAAVGLPILGVVASALSRTSSLHELASRVSPGFAVVFTCALYLTIGPFFAIPRTATVSYQMAFGSLTGSTAKWALLGFSAVFFGLVLAAALRPGKLMDIVGRYLTPIFLVLLSILLVVALVRGGTPAPEPMGPYAKHAATQGILDGYNTMDALASLAFAIVIIEAVRRLGVSAPGAIAREVSKAGVVAAIGMGVIYAALAVVGSKATGVVARDADGATGLATIATTLFGSIGHVLAAAIMLFACLKTAIGLVVACAEMFASMFGRVMSYRGWAVLFTLISFGLANVGLKTIIQASIPVLMLLYPMTIVLIVLALLHGWVASRPWAWRLPMAVAGLIALVAVAPSVNIPGSADLAVAVSPLLPGFDQGFGWIIPAAIALVIGMFLPRAEVVTASDAPVAMDEPAV